VIYEESPLPPPASKAYAAPLGSSNDDDDLSGVVAPKEDEDGTEDVSSA
jgi:hypothetical protein